jgi:hypothetical protein
MIRYTPEKQQVLFPNPFHVHLDNHNRWIRFAHHIPWDDLATEYYKAMHNGTGAPALNARLVIGALIIKHLMAMTDEDTIEAIRENLYMQYFVGLPCFQTEPVFDPSLFVYIRKRLDVERWQKFNEIFIEKSRMKKETKPSLESTESNAGTIVPGTQEKKKEEPSIEELRNQGELIIDATVAGQDIAYPNDLRLLNQSREKLEELIDGVVKKTGVAKPRTYRRKARKQYLAVAMKKRRKIQEIRKGLRQQLAYVRRDLKHLDTLLINMGVDILNEREREYLEVIREVYRQQKEMYDQKVNRCKDRIVSIHQPHVRPMKRGKNGSDVEFGSKIGLSLAEGYVSMDTLRWDNYDEAGDVRKAAENYKQRYGYYPEKMFADGKYLTKANKDWCEEKHIQLCGRRRGKPKRNLSAEERKQLILDTRKRIPIEGKIGQAKRKYGLDYVMAKLQNTSESWIGAVIFVLNLVRWEQYFFVSFGNIRFMIFRAIRPLIFSNRVSLGC